MDSRIFWSVSLTIVTCFFYLFVTGRPPAMALRARFSSRSRRFISDITPISDQEQRI
jgi:hypothetical protein